MDDFDRATIVNNDGLLSGSRAFLWICGFVYLILGCAGSYRWYSPDMPQVVAILVAIVFFLFTAVCAIFNFVVANALANGSKWSWYAGIVIGLMYLPSCCFPIGALVLVGLLRPSVRQAYRIQ